MDCLFCAIINGDIPSKKVYEDENTIAILDISQATKGHTLVLPKKHYTNLLEISDNDYNNVMIVTKKLAKKITTNLNAEGVNILNNCGVAAGQTVMHYHVHIIPRYKEDDLVISFNDHSKDYSLEEIQSLINK